MTRVAARRVATPQLALGALFLGAAGVALAPIFVREADVGATATGFYRFLLSMPVLGLWLLVENARRPDRPALSARDIWVLAISGFFFAADVAFYHSAIHMTAVANAALFLNFAPIFVVLGAWLIFDERFSRAFLAGLALALVGAAVLMSRSFSLSLGNLLGDAFSIAAASFYGSYMLAISRLRMTLSTATIMAWSGLATTLSLLPLTLASGETLVPSSLRGWLMLLGLALVSQAAGQGLIAYAFAHLPAAFSAVALLLTPVLAALFAWLLLGEPVGASQMIGGAIVLGGIYLARRASLR